MIDPGTMEFKKITPKMADAWLAMGSANRGLQRSTVDRYKNDMIAGRWIGRDCHLTLSDAGVLNGQHTLTAVVESGCYIDAWVQTLPNGVTARDLRVDIGSKRSAAYLLDQSNAIVSASRILYWMAERRHWDVTVDMIGDVCKHIEPEMSRLTTASRPGITLAPVRAAVCFSMWRYPDDATWIAIQYDAIANDANMELWSGFHSATRQLRKATDAGDRWYAPHTFLRFARGLSEQSRHASLIKIPKPDVFWEELRPDIQKYIGMDS